jgi:hypothetical protein
MCVPESCPDEFLNWMGDTSVPYDTQVLRVTKLVEFIKALLSKESRD